jgi:hypothetical protein
MTAEQKARLFGQVFGLLDSDQPGERTAALDRLHALRDKMGWPRFADLLQKLESTITPEQLEAAERSRADWERAHGERVKENTALARRNAALAARVAALRSTLWFMVNWRMVAVAGLVLTLGSGGWWWWSSAEAAPDQAPVAGAAATDGTLNDTLNAALADSLRGFRWRSSETAPLIFTVGTSAYWIVLRGSVDAHSHVDANGRPIERHCLQLYAARSQWSDGAYLTPSPYLAFGVWLKWPLIAAECRLPGTWNYK